MIGQKKIREQLASLTNLPNFIILIGAKGSGRHTLIKEEAKRRNINLVELSNKIETLEQLNFLNDTLKEEIIYLVDAENISSSATSCLLKVGEETSSNIHLVLLTTSRDKVLDTLLSRASTYELSPYTREEKIEYLLSIKMLYNIEDIYYYLDYVINFGFINELLSTENKGVDLINFCLKVKNNIDRASLINAFKLESYLNVKDDSKGYPIKLFAILMSLLFKGDKNRILISENLYKNISNPSISKSGAFYRWLYDIKMEGINGSSSIK